MSRVDTCCHVSRVPCTVWFCFWLASLHTVVTLFVLLTLSPNHNDHTNKTCVVSVAPVPEIKKEEPELVAPAPKIKKDEPAMIVTKIGEWGGGGGWPWHFLPSGGGVTKILVDSGEYVDSISFFGRDRAGNLDFSGRIGSGYGSSHSEVTLEWPEEYLTAISGTTSDFCGSRVVRSLEFTTNRGRKYGPFGRAGGREFNISMKGSAIVGFHGRKGYKVDAIGVYITPVSSIVK